jgi:hypothetical protein
MRPLPGCREYLVEVYRSVDTGGTGRVWTQMEPVFRGNQKLHSFSSPPDRGHRWNLPSIFWTLETWGNLTEGEGRSRSPFYVDHPSMKERESGRSVWPTDGGGRADACGPAMGLGKAGRTPDRQSRGRRFDPGQLHHLIPLFPLISWRLCVFLI